MITDIYNYLLEQILNNQFAQGGIVIGLMTSCLYYLRVIPIGIFNMIKRKIVYSVTIIDSYDGYYSCFNQWLYDNYSKSFRNVKVKYKGYWSDNNTITRNIELEQYIDNFTFWYKGWPIMISKVVEKKESTYNKEDAEIGKFTLTTVFNIKILNDLISNVIKHDIYKKSITRKSKSYCWNNKQGWEYRKTFEYLNENNIILDDNVKSGILNKYYSWKSDKEILKLKGIDLGLTYMFYGAPGCGKSSMASLLAVINKCNIYYLNLNSVLDLDTLDRAITQIPDESILLIEEIEDVYKGREQVDPNCKIPISGLLNIMSGTIAKKNLIIILTGNSIENLDSALIRPGRIDYFAEFNKPTKELVVKYINMFYSIDCKLTDIKNLPESMAQLENWCVGNLHSYDNLINKLNNV